MTNSERIRPEIAALIKRGNVTSEEFKEFGFTLNGYEKQALIDALSDEALLSQAPEYDALGYNMAFEGSYGPTLLRRYKELIEPPKGVSVKESISRAYVSYKTMDCACELSDAFLRIYPHGIPEHEMDEFWAAVYRVEALTRTRRAIKKLS